MSWLGRLRPDRLRKEDGGFDKAEAEEGDGEEEDEPKWEAVEEEEEEEEAAEQGGGKRTVVGFRPTGWCYMQRATRVAAANGGDYRPWVRVWVCVYVGMYVGMGMCRSIPK
jgi:hypothetical protein